MMDDHDDGLGPLGQGSGDPSRPFAFDGDSGATEQPTYSETPLPVLDDDPTEPYEPIVPLNPWISILYRPRNTIRYVLDTGSWNSWIMIYTILFLITVPPGIVGFFAQPDPLAGFGLTETPFGLPEWAFILLILIPVFAVIYPFALLLVGVKGWLYKWFGSWLGGVATTSECLIAIVWGGTVQKYSSYVGMGLNFFVIAYYRTTPDYPELAPVFIALILGSVMLPFWVYSLVIHSKSLAEAHRFSAWRGLGATLIMAVLQFVLVFGIGLGLFFIALAIGFTAAAAGGP